MGWEEAEPDAQRISGKTVYRQGKDTLRINRYGNGRRQVCASIGNEYETRSLDGAIGYGATDAEALADAMATCEEFGWHRLTALVAAAASEMEGHDA